jgi:hypothetical protein
MWAALYGKQSIIYCNPGFDAVKKNERCGIYKLKVIVNNDKWLIITLIYCFK